MFVDSSHNTTVLNFKELTSLLWKYNINVFVPSKDLPYVPGLHCSHSANPKMSQNDK